MRPVRREKLLVESERLHRTLLDGVSHELKTPLAVLGSVAENIAGADETLRASLVAEMRTATRRLTRLVNNLLDQTRLESGTLKPRLDWCDTQDLVNAAISGVEDSLAGHPFEVAVRTAGHAALSGRFRLDGAGHWQSTP